MFQSLAQNTVESLVSLMTDAIFPLLFLGLFVALFGKTLVYMTVKRQWNFSREFEKRVVRFLEKKGRKEEYSFFLTLKKLLERTYYESFKVRSVMMRRKLDYITSPVDRLFAIQEGCARLVSDTLNETRHLKQNGETPRFLEISKATCSNNPAFSRLWGWIPIGPLNDILNLLPGLFIIGGIFGTFLGIMEALPDLSGMDLENIEKSKLTMDTFLLKISFSLGTSILGIFFSVLTSLFYSLLGSEKLFLKIVDTYDRSITRLWEASSDNELPESLEEFDENKDSLEALAHISLQEDLKNIEKQEQRKKKLSDRDAA